MVIPPEVYEPAFPAPKTDDQEHWFGLTKREFIAAMIAGGDAANGVEGGWGQKVSDEALQIRALLYVRLADAILDAANE